MKGTLFLFPNLLGEHKEYTLFLPASVAPAVERLDGLIAESESGGRRFLGRFKTAKPAHNIPIALLRNSSSAEEIRYYLEPLMQGENWGLVSDAGLPCIADPGAALVRRARQLGIKIQAFTGPSAITLALMLSGLPGQRFAFCGYLPKDPQSRSREVSLLQKRSREQQSTQIFIEAPYRNEATLKTVLETLSEESWLCVAWDLTLPSQGLISQPMALWRKTPLPNLAKKPAIFLICAEPEAKGGRNEESAPL